MVRSATSHRLWLDLLPLWEKSRVIIRREAPRSVHLLHCERPNSSGWCGEWSRRCCGSGEHAWVIRRSVCCTDCVTQTRLVSLPVDIFTVLSEKPFSIRSPSRPKWENLRIGRGRPPVFAFTDKRTGCQAPINVSVLFYFVAAGCNFLWAGASGAARPSLVFSADIFKVSSSHQLFQQVTFVNVIFSPENYWSDFPPAELILSSFIWIRLKCS